MANPKATIRLVALASLVLMLAGGCSDASETANPDSHDLISATFDPVSTDDLQGPGGASIEPIDVVDLPAMSDASIEVTVLDVRPSRLNTVDGKFPGVDVARSSDQLRGLLVYTEVEVRVDAVHGLRPAGRGISVGDQLTITVDGGLVETILPPAEAAALGIRIPLDEPEGSVEDPDPGGPRLEPAPPTEQTEDDAEVVPTEATPYAMGIASFYSLTEGDRILMFVVDTTQPGFRIADFEVLEPTHPYGIFHKSGDTWLPDRAAAEGVDPIALAKQVGEVEER